MLLAVAIILDLIRGFFQFFWFFGPAFFALYCTHTASGWVSSLWGLTALACGAGAAAAGAALVEFTAPIGVIMADAIGFISFLALGIWIIMANARIFKTVVTGPFYFVSAFAIGEIPFLGAFPVFTIVIWRLYRTQIRVEDAALKKWQEEHAVRLRQEREQQAAEYAQMQKTLAGRQAANDEADGEKEQEGEGEIPRYGT